MKFWEAMKALEEGNKVRVSTWSEGGFLKLGKDSIVDESNHDFGIKSFWVYKEWHLYEEPVKTYSFVEAVKLMKLGKRVKRKGWTRSYIYATALSNAGFIFYEDNLSAFRFKIEDIEETDWIVCD